MLPCRTLRRAPFRLLPRDIVWLRHLVAGPRGLFIYTPQKWKLLWDVDYWGPQQPLAYTPQEALTYTPQKCQLETGVSTSGGMYEESISSRWEDRHVIKSDEMLVKSTGLMKCSDVAEALGCSERTVRRMTKARMIPFVKIGYLVRFRPQDIARHIASNTIQAVCGQSQR